MKILQIHNYYDNAAPSGENVVVDNEREMLRDKGHQVETLYCDNSNLHALSLISKLKLALGTVWSFHSYFTTKYNLKLHKPDIIHIHNTHPQISLSSLWAARKYQTVMTFHNYRPMCIKGTPIRAGKVCMKCISARNPLPGIFYRCYRNSLPLSILMGLSQVLHNMLGTYNKTLNYMFVLSNWQRKIYELYGFDKKKLIVKHNYTPDPYPLCRPDLRFKISYDACFVGRLSPEKGIDTFLKYWDQAGRPFSLAIAGSGDLLDDLVRTYGDGPKITFFGNVSGDKVLEILSASKLLVLPSMWFEGFPMVLAEAVAVGLPVVGSDVSGIGDLITSVGGKTFSMQNEEDGVDLICRLLNDPNELAGMGISSREFYDKQLSLEAQTKFFEDLINQRKQKSNE